MRTGRRRPARRALVYCVLAAALLLGAHSGAAAHEGEDEPLPADTGGDLRPVYEIPAGADRDHRLTRFPDQTPSTPATGAGACSSSPWGR